jgi:tetratricopeptide (TPR) repeat protein/SAM-dependent methyltransferase
VALVADSAQVMTDFVTNSMQQAMGHHGRGELDAAMRLYRRVLAREPEHADALHLSGVVAHQQGRNEEAVALINRAIAKSPSAPAFRNNLGMALSALGRTAEAEDAYQEALKLAPDFADALLNLGNLRGAQTLFEEAVTLLERAVAADSQAPQAHYSLGCARFALGDARGALSALERAIVLGADFSEAHYRTGSVHLSLGDLDWAVKCFAQALDRDSDHLGAQHGLLECLDKLAAGVTPDLLEAVIAPLLRGKSVNPRSIGHAAAELLERKHGFGSDNALQPSWQLECDHFLDDEVARTYLRRTVNVSAPLERLLTRRRASWLAEAGDEAAIAQSRWGGIGAVAIQCFLNEFVWAVSEAEERAVVEIEKRIVTACSSTVSPDAGLVSDLLVYACFRPVWRIACAARLRAVPANRWPEPLAETLRVSLHEPMQEHDAKARIASGIAIRDRVSKAVQMQYEENPYPRWQALTRADVQSIEERVQRWNPGYVAPAALGASLRVLIAGCGTGMDAIDTALHLHDAEVTAVDLSRASLAYAMRKAEEYGLENIRFRQEDILAIGAPDEPYHFINCTGVLHHMRDPAAGLDRLVRLLVPGGLVRLALYSRLARGPLLEAREAIRASGFGPRERDIRRFRQRVLEEGAGGPLAELIGSTDFFSLSECRDLLFHVQETQLTLPGIRSLLESSGLGFLGFELTIPEVEQGFRREHPDAALTDLDAWDAYEHRHPHSFRAMYQFWCRKD